MSAAHHPQPYTALQQDRQARNRPANVHGAATAGTSAAAAAAPGQQPGGGGGNSGAAGLLRRDETFEERERRYNAARILESNEMLIWHSVARNESLPQTRLHFEKIVAGFDSSESEAEWEDDSSPPPAAVHGDERAAAAAGRSGSGTPVAGSKRERERDKDSPSGRSSRSGRTGTPA